MHVVRLDRSCWFELECCMVDRDREVLGDTALQRLCDFGCVAVVEATCLHDNVGSQYGQPSSNLCDVQVMNVDNMILIQQVLSHIVEVDAARY